MKKPVKQLVEDYLKKEGITLNEFCKKSKINHETYKNLCKGQGRLISAVKMSKILKLKLCEFFQSETFE